MPRSNWKGYISFGLVNIPITLYTSEDASEGLSFHQIDRKNNARIKYKRVNAETGREVPWEDIVKGYEYSKNKILVMKEGELERVAGENARTIAIESFINQDEIHFMDVQKTYLLEPGKNGDKGYVLLREALENTKKVGIAKVIISTKEYLAAIAVYQDALVLYLLHYQNELRKLSQFNFPSRDFKKYKVTSKEVDISKKLIQSMSTKWHPEKYKDEYKEAVHKWVEEAAKKMPHTVMEPRATVSTAKVIDFMELLKKSLKDNKRAGASRTKKRSVQRKQKTSASRSATRVH